MRLLFDLGSTRGCSRSSKCGRRRRTFFCFDCRRHWAERHGVVGKRIRLGKGGKKCTARNLWFCRRRGHGVSWSVVRKRMDLQAGIVGDPNHLWGIVLRTGYPELDAKESHRSHKKSEGGNCSRLTDGARRDPSSRCCSERDVLKFVDGEEENDHRAECIR
jgi:hypothetical protein